jgi:hypothetical protein
MQDLLPIVIAAIIALILLAAAAYYAMQSREEDSTVKTIPGSQRFKVKFDSSQEAPGLIVPLNCDPENLKQALGFSVANPTIFISGGASGMSEHDVKLTQQIVVNGIARFAQEHKIVVIDGGTESGVMKMMGDARRTSGYTFPLIGIAPLAKVDYPGHHNANKEASLENGHSHFVLVDGKEWGDESETIVNLTHAISGAGEKKALGIVINGGKITRQDIYLATSKERNLPILVLEGSGRFADELATAHKSGQTSEKMIKAILRGDITLISTSDGPQGVYAKLVQHFGIQQKK